MKIRSGFVSNSSSSSFVAVGTTDDATIKQLLQAEIDLGRTDFEDTGGYGTLQAKHVTFYGSPWCDGKPKKAEDINGEIWMAGWDIESLLRQGKTLKQICRQFRLETKKKLKVDVPLKDIDLHYGETGDG